MYSTKVNSRLSELVSLTADHDDDSQNCDRIGKSTSSSDSKDDDDAVYSNDIAGTEMNVWQTVKTLELWLIMWGSCCTLGSYSIIQFNVAQIAESYGHPNANAFCVLLTLVFAALGRLVAAYLHHRGNRELWPRGTQFVVLNATMLVAMLCLSAGGLAGLVVGVGIGGFVYGAYWTVVPLVFADMFGLVRTTPLQQKYAQPNSANRGFRVTCVMFCAFAWIVEYSGRIALQDARRPLFCSFSELLNLYPLV